MLNFLKTDRRLAGELAEAREKIARLKRDNAHEKRLAKSEVESLNVQLSSCLETLGAMGWRATAERNAFEALVEPPGGEKVGANGK